MTFSDTSDSQSSAIAESTQRVKRRRVRKTLSCTQCKERKIRCDREVPRCSSCVARGIQQTCRWGDERDNIVATTASAVLTEKRTSQQAKRTRDSSETEAAKVDVIVEAVLKKLKGGKEARSEPASTEPAAAKRLYIYDTIYVKTSRPPPAASANLLPVSAFRGARVYHPVRGVTHHTDQQVDADLIRASLRILPRRAVFDQLVDVFLDEVEPHKQIFNTVILRKQIDEFWQGVDELSVQPDSIAALQSTNVNERGNGGGGTAQMINLLFSADHYLTTDATQSFSLCDRVRQGLLAVVLALIDSATRSMSLSRLKALAVVPPNATKEEATAWNHDLHRRSIQHLSMSNYLQQPTLWSLQALLMQQTRWIETPDTDRCLAVLSVAITLAVNMGLNRLGSAYNDLEAMPDGSERQHASNNRSSQAGDSADAATAGRAINILSDSRYGASLSLFEEGDLALRELGRKVWCCMVWVDWTMAGHLDHYYSAHDGINHTAPPAPVDDDEIVSQKAPFALAKARMGIHRASLNEVIGLRMAQARASRVQTDLENQKGYMLSYEDVMMVDEGFCEVIEMVPEYLQLKSRRDKDPSADAHLFGNPPPTIHEQSLQRQACMLQDQIHFRRLRLHRMSFGKGLKEARYRPSVLACLQAARVILAVRRQLEEDHVKMWGAFVLQSHLFHAALVLQLVLLYEMDRMRAASSGNGARKSVRNSHADVDVYVLDDFDATLQQLDEAVGYLQSSEQSHFSRELLPGLATFLSGVQEYNDRQKLAQMRAESHAKEGAKDKTGNRSAPATSTRRPRRDSGGKERLQDSHTDAAAILASIPMVDAEETQWPRPANKTFPPLNPHIGSISHEHSGTASTPNTSLSTLSPHSLPPWPAVAPFGPSQQHSTFADPLVENNVASSDAVVAAHSANEAYDPSIWSLEALFPDYAAGEVDLIAALERSFFGGTTVGAPGFLQPDSTSFAASTGLPNIQQSAPQWPSMA